METGVGENAIIRELIQIDGAPQQQIRAVALGEHERAAEEDEGRTDRQSVLAMQQLHLQVSKPIANAVLFYFYISYSIFCILCILCILH